MSGSKVFRIHPHLSRPPPGAAYVGKDSERAAVEGAAQRLRDAGWHVLSVSGPTPSGDYYVTVRKKMG